jgi:membrane-associated phospholipid phosphatase
MLPRMERGRSERAVAPRWVVMLAAGSAAATAAAIVTIDEPIARALAGYEPLAIWDGGVAVLEWIVLLPVWRFALPVGLVAAMLATVAVLRWRAAAPPLMLVAGVHLATRLTTGWIKDATGRLRPGEWLARGGDDGSFFQDGISFPSGHVALFASIVLPLMIVWPRARVPLAAIAGFAALARIAAGAHFVSDALGAITLVALWTVLVAAIVRPRPASHR